MFITKKKYEETIDKVKREVADQWERKFCEQDRRFWEDQEKNRIREDFARRFDSLEKRIYTLEKEVGLVEETRCCRCDNAVAPLYF